MCRDCLDTSCIEVCPVDCIYEYVGPASAQFPNPLYIDPDECLDCQACEPVCPWEAPLRDTEVPPVFDDDIALNASIVEHKDKFPVAGHTESPSRLPAASPPTSPSGAGPTEGPIPPGPSPAR